MRLRLMATYRGVPYQVGLGPDGTDATLFSPGPPPEELGFTAAVGHWRKQVSVTELDTLWQSRPAGDYRGEPCLVLDDLGDRLHIAYLGRDAARAAQLGYWEIDREVFEVVVARSEVIGLTEERVDFPLAAAMFPPPGGPAGPQAQEDPAAGANGYRVTAGKAGPGEYRSAAVNGGPAGKGQLAGDGGSDHASRMPDRMAAWHGSPEPWPGPQDAPGPPEPEPEASPEREAWPEPEASPEREAWPEPEASPEREAWPEPETWAEPSTVPVPVPGRRTGRKDRISPESVFAELLSLADIPQAAYAVDEEIPGAMCLVEADGGFEVFSRTDDARLEVHFFEDEEAAYFYLFGVLAAEAVRSGRLGPSGPAWANGHHNGSGPGGPTTPSEPPPTSAENVSKYLRGRKLPNSASHPARVYLAGGADGPPLPKQPRRPPEPLVD
jgi:hypothetical protein